MRFFNLTGADRPLSLLQFVVRPRLGQARRPHGTAVMMRNAESKQNASQHGQHSKRWKHNASICHACGHGLHGQDDAVYAGQAATMVKRSIHE